MNANLADQTAEQGGLEMVSVYGRKRKTASPGGRVTWMDRFTELEPEGGFRTVYLMWQRKRPNALNQL